MTIDDTLRELEDRPIELTQSEQQGRNRLKTEQSMKNLWDNKRSNIHIFKAPKEKRKEYRTKNFPNLIKYINLQETERNLNVIHPKKSTPRHIITEFMKVKGKEKNVK